MLHALFKFANNPFGGIDLDTTSNSGRFRDLSPFVLSAPPAKNFENLWQFSKVYKKYIMPIDGYPDASWYKWQDNGFSLDRAIRYPMGKGAIPEYSLWDGERLGCIQARKKIYAPEYAKNVAVTESFALLKRLHADGETIILRDYDAYDHLKLNMSLVDVINNPKRKMGHAFVLIMMLTNQLEECLK